MKNNHILIVEDEWVIYDELASFLITKGYSTAPYTKSFEDATNQIKTQIPDMVLLDINLQGDKDGIDLGEELSSKYNIPFIYLSAYSDEVIVNRARRTNPDTFLLKTKPNIDKEQLYITIKMALSKDKGQKNQELIAEIEDMKIELTRAKEIPHLEKKGIIVYADYPRDTGDKALNELKKKLLSFDDILWITTENTKRNYVAIHSNGPKTYLRSPLSKIEEILPVHFVRINASEIINLKKVEGKINHSSFKINNTNFKIGPNYSDEVHKVLHSFYYE
ncbi:MAG: hypothetical protein DRJ05_11435 [Bacteroidetes bacterium]|nr:MAG: hypothetical protein DRJ05_11435 [Bacteroidota bacterium]